MKRDIIIFIVIVVGWFGFIFWYSGTETYNNKAIERHAEYDQQEQSQKCIDIVESKSQNGEYANRFNYKKAKQGCY